MHRWRDRLLARGQGKAWLGCARPLRAWPPPAWPPRAWPQRAWPQRAWLPSRPAMVGVAVGYLAVVAFAVGAGGSAVRPSASAGSVLAVWEHDGRMTGAAVRQDPPARPAAAATSAHTGPARSTPAARPGKSTAGKPTTATKPKQAAAARKPTVAKPKPVAGLNQAQMNNANAIVQAGRAQKLPPRALVIAVATAMQESTLRNLASAAIPESLRYSHEGVGADHDSVGLFQQRPSAGWGAVRDLMRPSYAATQFYLALKRVSGWQHLSLTAAAQAVQVSAYPYAYAKHEGLATTVVSALT